MLGTYNMETPSSNPAQADGGLKENAAARRQDSQAVSRQVEASRYALLQRLAPGIRHQVAGTFQPIMMLASMMQRLAQAVQIDVAKVGAHSTSMHSFSHDGAKTSLALFSWVSSSANTDISVNEGVSECLNLVATELALREFTITNELAACTDVWPREALRHVFMAAILAISDVAPSPAELVLSSENIQGRIALILKVHSVHDAALLEAVPIYRKMEWLDVEVLAQSEGVSLERLEDGVRLSLVAHS